ncbi:MAG: transcription elongation factor subunit Spt4 [Candidatus Thermoplasmatota archaeon]
MKACKKCRLISEGDICPKCSGETSKDWQGYLIIVDYTKSEIAKKLEINENGRFALRVR